MHTIDTAHQYLYERDISEEELRRCTAYIYGYVDELCQIYGVEITEDEHEEVTENMYRAFLNQVVEFTDEMDTTAERQIDDSLDDFDAGGKTAMGNIIVLLGRANAHPETRTPLITQLTAMALAESQDHEE